MVGRWVLSLLPPVAPFQEYVEPFGGMANVLLNRQPAPAGEVINDLDGRVNDFWFVIRDHQAEFSRLLKATPHSRQVFEEAKALLECAPPETDRVKRAWAFVVLVAQSLNYFQIAWQPPMGAPRVAGHPPIQWQIHIARLGSDALADRLRKVSLDCLDGSLIVARHASNPNAVIYCDPPYADTKGYESDFNPADLIEACRGAKAKIAISGYRSDPYDQLGWERHETETYFGGMVVKEGKRERRVECLWVNYEPPVQAELFTP